jgi:DNA repair protein RadC
MEELRQEKFKVFFLDKKFKLLDEFDQDGWVENVEIDIKTIIKKALNCSAKYLILTHNHPSGDIKPSKADIASTDKIIESLKVVEIKIYDHIIIGKNGAHYSFRESGLI